MSAAKCQFPLFRHKFWGAAAWTENSTEGVEMSSMEASSSGSAEGDQHQQARGGNKLMTLDLRALPRDEGPPTELQARREKFLYFEKRCSEVADGLFLGSDAVARNREILRASGVTHVINCVGFLFPCYFKDELTYMTLFLQDTPAEDVTAVLYDVFNFIEAARKVNGRVLVHCSQGVSRSATLVISYLMWRLDQPYDETFQAVKAIRGVANPNIGFTCQLLNWHKRRHSPLESCRVYRMAPQSSAAASYLVAKGVTSPQMASLDPRGAFVVQLPDRTYIWQGSRCLPEYVSAAASAAASLERYENAPGPATIVLEGREPRELLAALGGPGQVCECEAYSRDYQMFSEALSAAAMHSDTSGSGSGRNPKTPRAESSDGESGLDHPGSPNTRSRKYRRADVTSPANCSPRPGSLLETLTGRTVSLDSAADTLTDLSDLAAPPLLSHQHSAKGLPLPRRSNSGGMLPVPRLPIASATAGFARKSRGSQDMI
ncbi:hypothetical protein WJX72_000780 [[Myrmecia] bisecta]|uniref:Uncharacterized protein n=1 Tax=[Myrmecia] bisecta TaxID=41462 RepID=A0AAW1R4P6_9CHLO